MITNPKNKSGFTLVETLVVINLGLLISVTAIAIFVSGLKQIQSARNLTDLHSNAIFLSNTINYWVKQGKNLSLPSPNVLEITLPDSSFKMITRENNNLTIDGSVFNLNNIEVTQLSFDKLEKSVRISFTLRMKKSGETFSLKTTISQRNNL
ncbi:MAG: hypothetical protein A2V72_02325 [Candidatus Nealsonbacteria bacterium RBG_13_37_56]|uniref:Prepilin-type N-terminal cleavage/methylation domain-containing protein n=1 Tax=Candidatus Nealsonbacteria bacterium RBG_13_37_56 TaxID=1801661 RepID=A0A1G2DW25_9BACT|nr:MAG: hypothetical protein A2V72_02325 [Candidatus Nealsonbacteria bacterium RBG_13_37_56]